MSAGNVSLLNRPYHCRVNRIQRSSLVRFVRMDHKGNREPCAVTLACRGITFSLQDATRGWTRVVDIRLSFRTALAIFCSELKSVKRYRHLFSLHMTFVDISFTAKVCSGTDGTGSAPWLMRLGSMCNCAPLPLLLEQINVLLLSMFVIALLDPPRSQKVLVPKQWLVARR